MALTLVRDDSSMTPLQRLKAQSELKARSSRPPRTALQKARPGGRGNRLPGEVREAEGSHTSTKLGGPHDLPGLGNAPAGFPADLRRIWNRLREAVPWLRRSDRMICARYVRLLALHDAAYEHVQAGGGVDEGGQDSPHWRQFLATGDRLLRIESKLGTTPADRSRIVGGF